MLRRKPDKEKRFKANTGGEEEANKDTDGQTLEREDEESIFEGLDLVQTIALSEALAEVGKWEWLD